MLPLIATLCLGITFHSPSIYLNCIDKMKACVENKRHPHEPLVLRSPHEIAVNPSVLSKTEHLDDLVLICGKEYK